LERAKGFEPSTPTLAKLHFARTVRSDIHDVSTVAFTALGVENCIAATDAITFLDTCAMLSLSPVKSL
jgi:hypothetical protein